VTPRDNRRTVYVAGWPKSGSSWFAWLLGDALDCPVGAWNSNNDERDFATEGRHRKGPFVVRRGHFRLVDDEGGPAALGVCRLAWKNLTDEAVFYIIRDPRDVLVSAAHYWGRHLAERLDWMISGHETHGNWNDTINEWLDAPFKRTLMRYEVLVADCPTALHHALVDAGLPRSLASLKETCMRQCFNQRRRSLAARPGGRFIPEAFFWKGQAGSWKGRLDCDMGKQIEEHFGATMRRLGYEDDPEWWRDLPERALSQI